MNEIIELATKLGKAIAQSKEAATLREARKALDSQADVLKLLGDYQQHSDKMAKLESENKPIEVDDKRKLQELHGKLIASEIFKKFTSAQVNYVDLMWQVSTVMRQQLSETEKE